jgi:hypothetical protein
VVLEFKFRAMCLLGRRSTTWAKTPGPPHSLFFYPKAAHYLAQAGFELVILLPPECWDFKRIPLCLAGSHVLFKCHFLLQLAGTLPRGNVFHQMKPLKHSFSLLVYLFAPCQQPQIKREHIVWIAKQETVQDCSRWYGHDWMQSTGWRRKMGDLWIKGLFSFLQWQFYAYFRGARSIRPHGCEEQRQTRTPIHRAQPPPPCHAVPQSARGHLLALVRSMTVHVRGEVSAWALLAELLP